MAHYEVSRDVVGHCLRGFDHLGPHGREGVGEVMTIAQASAKSLYLKQMRNGQVIGMATGFVVVRERPFLVTNQHVLWGKDAHGRVAMPDTLVIKHNREGAFGQYEEKEEPLHDGKGALWYEHPTLRQDVDVAALPLSDTTGVELMPYDPWDPGPGLRADLTDPLNVIGFPFGITGGAAFGVWTRGFVATQPEIDWSGLPCFLIDSRTRPGQSGSPVIAYAEGSGVPTTKASLHFFDGPVEQLFGLYSGRIDAESDLGKVWKPRALREVIEGKSRSKGP